MYLQHGNTQHIVGKNILQPKIFYKMEHGKLYFHISLKSNENENAPFHIVNDENTSYFVMNEEKKSYFFVNDENVVRHRERQKTSLCN